MLDTLPLYALYTSSFTLNITPNYVGRLIFLLGELYAFSRSESMSYNRSTARILNLRSISRMRLRILRPGLSSPSFPPQLRWMQTLSLEVLEAELAKLVPVRTWLRDRGRLMAHCWDWSPRSTPLGYPRVAARELLLLCSTFTFALFYISRINLEWAPRRSFFTMDAHR